MKQYILMVICVVATLVAALGFGSRPVHAASISISGSCTFARAAASVTSQSIEVSGGGQSSGPLGPYTGLVFVGLTFVPALPDGTVVTATIVGTGTSASYTCHGSGGAGGSNCKNPDPDGRLNAVCYDAAQAAALYCSSDRGSMMILRVQKSVGSLAFNVSQQELDKVPALPKVNTLVKQAMGIQLWRLTTGELQFNTPNGEAYTFGLPVDGPVTFNQICRGQVNWYHPLG